jgi:4'-phosphopantetheinyl transferase
MKSEITVKIIFTEGKQFPDYAHLAETLPEYRQEKIKNLLRDEDKMLSLAAGVLIEKNLPKNAVIKYGEFGKPYIDGISDVHFSVAHTKGAVVFVKTDSPVGIDIEKAKPFDSMYDIAKKYFTDREYEYCNKSGERFFEIWTKKEAFAKKTGKGLSEHFRSFDTISDESFLSARLNGFYISVCVSDCNYKGKQLIFDEVAL